MAVLLPFKRESHCQLRLTTVVLNQKLDIRLDPSHFTDIIENLEERSYEGNLSEDAKTLEFQLGASEGEGCPFR